MKYDTFHLKNSLILKTRIFSAYGQRPFLVLWLQASVCIEQKYLGHTYVWDSQIDKKSFQASFYFYIYCPESNFISIDITKGFQICAQIWSLTMWRGWESQTNKPNYKNLYIVDLCPHACLQPPFMFFTTS